MQSRGCKFTREAGKVETDSPNRSISAEDSGHYNLLAAVACAVSAHLAFVYTLVATALWAVSTCECTTELDRPQAGGYRIKLQKKRPRSFRGRLPFLHGKQLCRYGLVVVVVVVSSCLITAAGWEANTTLRTTTRSPTVE